MFKETGRRKPVFGNAGQEYDMSEQKNQNAMNMGEVIKFLIAGGVCFVVQTVALVLLRDVLGIPTLVAFPIAFLIAMVVNYIMSVLWIWPSAKDSGLETKIGFLVSSIIGLLINELVMWLMGLIFGEDQVLFTVFGWNFSMYLFNECVATAIAMIWNFFTKRAILQSSLIKKWTDKLSAGQKNSK